MAGPGCLHSAADERTAPPPPAEFGSLAVVGAESEVPAAPASDGPELPEDDSLRWIRGGVATIASICVHCLIVLLLAMAAYPRPATQEPIVQGDEVRIAVAPPQPVVLDPPEGTGAPREGAPQEGELEAAAPPALAEEQFSLVASNPLAPETDWAVNVPVDLPLEENAFRAIGAAPRRDLLSPAGGRQTMGQATFMGLQADGRRFCIIADCSGSMKGAPLGRVKVEVRKTLARMRPAAQFHLLFYADFAKGYPTRWGDPHEDLRSTVRWLARINAEGGTNPTPAFKKAFRLRPRPDAIFFMTDGRIPGKVIGTVRRLNRKRPQIPIHTISFLTRRASILLQQIARDSGGKYRHVADF